MSGRSCSRQSTKRYTSRPSPPYPANACCGLVMTGNDGQKYISKRASTGVCRWVKVEQKNKSVRKSGKTYEIHDNGGRPFRVRVTGKHNVELMKAVDEEKGDYKTFSTLHANDVMIGKSSPAPNRERSPAGNNILLALPGGKYLYIGMQVRQFSPVKNDQIRKFYSDIGNSDVPYAYGVGDHHIYFFDTFDEGKVTAVERSFFRPLTEKDSYYNQYYEPFFMKMCLKGGANHRDICKDRKAARARIDELEEKTILLPSKLVHKRLY